MHVSMANSSNAESIALFFLGVTVLLMATQSRPPKSKTSARDLKTYKGRIEDDRSGSAPRRRGSSTASGASHSPSPVRGASIASSVEPIKEKSDTGESRLAHASMDSIDSKAFPDFAAKEAIRKRAHTHKDFDDHPGILDPTKDLEADETKKVEPFSVHLLEKAHCGNAIVIGIAGGSGSGKTTLSKAVYDELGEESVTFISHDSYYKDLSHLCIEERANNNFDHPDSLDTGLLVEHVEALRAGYAVEVPIYDYSTHSRTKQTEHVLPRPVILVEGILIFSDEALQQLMDIKIFVDTDDDIRLIRRLQRDTVERGRTVESVVNQYIKTVRPMHLEFVEPSKRNAHLIVPVGLNSVALGLLVSHLRTAIEEFEEAKSSSSSASNTGASAKQ